MVIIMKRFIMCSGGKDSMATVIYAYEHGIKCDGVVISEVMFDNKRNISAEHPLHADWLHDYAIPFVKKEFGFNVFLLRAKKDYLTIFNERICSSATNIDRIGRKKGFVLGSRCVLRRDLKIKPINDWCKQQGEFEKILGLSYDEEERLAKMYQRKNERSLLAEAKIAEFKTFDICRSYGLLSPYYGLGLERQGCWFCPNCSVKTFACFAKSYPALWNELRILSKDKEVVSPYFRYSETFEQVDCKVNFINSQISLFDYLGTAVTTNNGSKID